MLPRFMCNQHWINSGVVFGLTGKMIIASFAELSMSDPVERLIGLVFRQVRLCVTWSSTAIFIGIM